MAGLHLGCAMLSATTDPFQSSTMPRKENPMTRILIIGCVLAGLLCTAGCNTIQGAGKDIQKAGEVVEKAAKKAKKG